MTWCLSARSVERRPDRLGADLAGVVDDALGLHRVERRDDRRHRERMPRVGQPAREHAVVEVGGDGVGDDHAARGHVARVDALREGDEVGAHVVAVEREPAAGAAEARHHLVEDQHDAVPVAELAHARRGSRAAARARPAVPGIVSSRTAAIDDGPLGLDDPAQVPQRALGLLLGRRRPELASGRGRARRSARARGRTRWGCAASRRSRRSRRRCCRGTSGRSRGPCRGRCAGAPSGWRSRWRRRRRW